ncbi:MAG: IS110 family transposase [Enterococcus lemanii]|jgi:transposase
MFYLGIDIGKRTHVASIMNAEGKVLLKGFSFANSLDGAHALLERLTSFSDSTDDFLIGMEATGHYWLALFSFLDEQQFLVHVINPIQTDGWRKGTEIRKRKNDTIDSVLIADLIRYGSFNETALAIGDIRKFSNPKKLVAYAGIDASVTKSGEYEATHNVMSKRGSPYLRKALFQAAIIASRCDPVFKAFYDKKRAEGKHHLTAIGAVSRKLCYIIHAILIKNEPYEIRQ